MSDELLLVLLPQLRGVDVESVAGGCGVVVITARTRDGPADCTGCGQSSGREHSRCLRHVAH